MNSTLRRYKDKAEKQDIFIQTDSRENCRVLFCRDLFHLKDSEGDKITVTEELHLSILQIHVLNK
jgi:hypothetical protein